MSRTIGLFSPDELPLARTAGFHSELIKIADGDTDTPTFDKHKPSFYRDDDPVVMTNADK
jgi:hypothetical protein